MHEANGIILSSLTYAGDYNAIMRNFPERLGSYTLYSAAFRGKYFVALSAANGKGAAAIAKKLAGACGFGIIQWAFLSGTMKVRLMYKGTEL